MDYMEVMPVLRIEHMCNRRNFILIANEDKIMDAIKTMKESYMDDTFVTVHEHPDEAGYLVKEQYMENVKRFEKDVLDEIENLKLNPKLVLDVVSKKKNGWAALNRKNAVSTCLNSRLIEEFTSSWLVNELRWVPLTESHLELQIATCYLNA